MRFKIFCLIWCLFGTKTVFSQTDSLWTLEGIANITVCLYQPIDNSQFVGGTGVVINQAGKYYLITAAHIAKTILVDAKVGFMVTGSSPIEIEFSALKSNKSKWTNHPVADIAIIELVAPNKLMEQRLAQHSFPSTLISKQKETVPLETPITFLGYTIFDFTFKPLLSPYRGPAVTAPVELRPVISTYPNFAPDVFVSRLAKDELLERKRFDNNKLSLFYYLDCQSKKGSEGSGVFYSTKSQTGQTGKTQLIGIMHGTPTEKKLPQFATVTPSFYIWDLLNQ